MTTMVSFKPTMYSTSSVTKKYVVEYGPGSGRHISTLCDDVMWKIFAELPLEDLIRAEGVCRRWQALQGHALRGRNRLMLLDDPPDEYPSQPGKQVETTPSVCSHWSKGNMAKDWLTVPTMYHLVSFLYFVAPRMSSVRTLYVSIYWTTPEQLSQVLAKFTNVQCLTLFGNPTDYCCQWTSMNNVLRAQYSTTMKHFVTNYHLWPEKHFDPLLESKFEAICSFVDIVFRRQKTPDPSVTNQQEENGAVPLVSDACFWTRMVSQVKGVFTHWFPSVVGGRQTGNDHDEQPLPQQEIEQFEQFDDMEPVEEQRPEGFGFWARLIDRVFSSRVVDFLYNQVKRAFNWQPNVNNSDNYFSYLHQLEELHIPGHFNRVNDRVYSFSPTVSNSDLLRRVTIGDCKILHSGTERMFSSLTFLDINDIWIPEYAYLYEKVTQCIHLEELRFHFSDAIEETTLDLLDFLEEGTLKQTEWGFQHLRSLTLDFPLASLSRQYFNKFRSIFPALYSLSFNMSRIKCYRRAKLINMIEHSTTGIKTLKRLHILSNGNSDTLDWLDGCNKIDTFDLTTLRLNDYNIGSQLRVFVKIAIARASRKKTQHQVIRLEVTPSQINKIKTKYTQVLARSSKSSLLTMVDNIRLVPIEDSLADKQFANITQYGMDSLYSC